MTTLLAIGDMHLGRLPSSLPEELRPRAATLGPETAWMRSVREAINRKVDAVVLAGDLVEQARDFFVAYGQLKAGLDKLAAAGIKTFAVAGNHDVYVLPRLAAELEQLELLGADGRWETVEIGKKKNTIELIGWSFPQAEVRHSPLDSFPQSRLKQVRIGLLHCDRDQNQSRHAPVASADLEAAQVSAWLLGHIHQPDDLTGERPIGYLGSVTALRASETGDRGPWLISTNKGKVSAEQLVLAPLRYETHRLDLSSLQRAEALNARILECARKTLSQMPESASKPDALGLRLTLEGRTRIAAEIRDAAIALQADARPWTEEGVQCFIDKIELALEPEIDLDQLAEQNDPCGLLAQRVLALRDERSEEHERLIELARARLMPLTDAREFKGLEGELSNEDLAHQLERAALLALNALLDQRGSAT
ncbi:MAG: metallophosphoesterase [Pseudomonadota bacterium]